jgi:alpha-L-fucosidase 2
MLWSWNATGYDPLNPIKWYQGAYIGNGLIGGMVTAIIDDITNTTQSLRIDIGRTDLWACSNRMPIGYITIQTAGIGKIVWVDMRLVLYTATLEVNLTVIDGAEPILVSFQVYINAGDGAQVLVIFVDTLTGGPNPLIINWIDDTIGACGQMQVESGSVNGQSWGSPIFYSTQITPDGTFTTAYTQYNEDCGQTFILAVENTQRNIINNSQSLAFAIQSVSDAVLLTVEGLATNQQTWWSMYWSSSFFAFDSAGRSKVTSLESFTIIALYRYASAARYTLSDLMGPWGPAHATTCIGPWCQLCWDMNEQVMMYLPMNSNRGVLLAKPAFDMIPSNYNNSWEKKYGSNSPGRGVNMLWFLAQMHRYIIYYGDNNRLVTDLLPALRVELLNSGLKNGTNDQYLHVEGCVSPEYPMGPSRDCNYNLAILKWAAETAQEIALELYPSDPALPTYTDIVSRIAPFPIDPMTGSWSVANNVQFTLPHRHYSHLLMMYDLKLTNFENNYTIMQKSLDTWFNITCSGPQAHGPDYNNDDECRGFTQAAMSAMSSILHRSDAALGNLTSYLTLVGLPNAMYGEEVYAGHPDEFSPVSESAYSAASSTIGLLISSERYPPGPQSGSTLTKNISTLIRLLPSSPFLNASFYRLRCENALLVSLVQINGILQWVAVEAELFTDGSGEGSNVNFILQQEIQWSTITSMNVISTNSTIVTSPVLELTGAFSITGLVRGSSAIFFPEGQEAPITYGITDILGRNASEANFWGSRFVFNGEFP